MTDAEATSNPYYAISATLTSVTPEPSALGVVTVFVAALLLRRARRPEWRCH